MTVVFMATEVMGYAKMVDLTRTLHERILRQETEKALRSTDSTYVSLTANEEDIPFQVHSVNHIAIFVAHLDKLCAYLMILPENYVFFCYLLGAVQRKTLEFNTLLKPEDLIHPTTMQCVFNTTGNLADYVVRLDKPVICRGCRDFYHALGCDGEMLNVIKMLKDIRQLYVGNRKMPH